MPLRTELTQHFVQPVALGAGVFEDLFSFAGGKIVLGGRPGCPDPGLASNAFKIDLSIRLILPRTIEHFGARKMYNPGRLQLEGG